MSDHIIIDRYAADCGFVELKCEKDYLDWLTAHRRLHNNPHLIVTDHPTSYPCLLQIIGHPVYDGNCEKQTTHVFEQAAYRVAYS